MQAQTPHATAIAYPLVANPPNPSQTSPSLDTSYFNLGLDQSTYSTNDSIDLGNNFFSQLDSMIAAVKVESNALDTMREKLKEVDNLRNQISTFTKRIIDADQLNLNLKSNLIKQQDAFNELKKQKSEIESSAVSLRQELNRTKDALNKERAARQQMQQELQQFKEQYARLEVLRDNLDREVKSIPALTESNEILKNDLANVRKRFKEEKASLQRHIKHLESQAKDVESIKGEVRQLAMRMMELSSGAGNGGGAGGGGGAGLSTMPTNNNYGASNRYDPQSSVMSAQSNANAYRSASNTYGNISTGHHLDEDDDEDGDDNSYQLGDNESEYDNHSFIDDNASQLSAPINGSMDSLPLPNHMNSAGNMQAHQGSMNQVKSSGKKKKIKKQVVTSARTHQQISQPQSMHMMQPMQSSFSLPRI